MQEIFAPDIDKINAPHENAHWNWDDATAKAAYEYGAMLFGTKGEYTISQWFAMMFSYRRNIQPLVEPPSLTKEQCEEWVKLSKAAMAARTWANPKCTPEMVVACDAKIRASRDTMKKTEAGRKQFMENMSKIWFKVCEPGHDDLGYE